MFKRLVHGIKNSHILMSVIRWIDSDAYPEDPEKWEIDTQRDEKLNLMLIIIVVVIILLILIAIIISIFMKNKSVEGDNEISKNETGERFENLSTPIGEGES